MCRTKNAKSNKLNSLDILMVSFGAMIGWGWIISSGLWIKQAGIIGTMIGFVLGGIMIYFIGLIYAELTTTFPKGGCMIFSYKAFGSTMSFICTWIMIFSYVGVVCFEACSLPTIIAYLIPNFMQVYLYSVAGFDIYLSWLLTAIGFALLIMIVNIIGIKTAAIFQNILTSIIAIVGIILICMSVIKGNIVNLNGQLINGNNLAQQIKNILVIATIAPFFLFGFDVIPQAVSDINVDLKKTGKILVSSIILEVLFYALIVLAIGLALNFTEINDSVNNSGLTAADAMNKLLKSELMVKVLILGGLCGIITSWNSFLIGGSRTIASLASMQMIPTIFSKKT